MWKTITFLLIPIAISAFVANFYRQVQIGSPGDGALVKFLLYNKRSSKFEKIPLQLGGSLPPEFSSSKNLTVWIHGFGDTPESPGFGGHLVDGFMKSSVETNFIAVDWTKLSEGFNSPVYEFFLAFFRAVKWNVPVVAEKVAEFLLDLEKKGLTSSEKVHLISFSTGCHLAGHAAQIFREKSGRKLARVTGLDPVGLGFEVFRIGEHMLGKEDAEFVDVYHTNIFFQGVIFPIGHLDVYVNNAVTQPGCPPINLKLVTWSDCPHGYSIKVYARTIKEDIIGKELSWCDVLPNWMCGNGDENAEKIAVGYLSSKQSRGSYRIQVKD